MGWRTTPDKVKAILAAGKDYDTVANPSLTPYITAANLLTTRVEACASAKDAALTAEELVEIEGWLAAWYYTKSDNKYSSRGTKSANGSFVTNPNEPESYKDAALALDTSGCLAAFLKGATTRMVWLGKTRAQKRTYQERNP